MPEVQFILDFVIEMFGLEVMNSAVLKIHHQVTWRYSFPFFVVPHIVVKVLWIKD